MRVYISPTFDRPDAGDGGIRRVVEAMTRYLPDYGIEVVDNPDAADLINCHAGSLVTVPGKPMVASNHGLYWSDYRWPEEMHRANDAVIEVLARAQAHTAVSEWVAHALARGMLINPEVIYHGVEPGEFVASSNPGRYVLWNKARADSVSNPADMQQLAALLPDVDFVTTIGRATSNVKVVGRMDYETMRTAVRAAGVYLATCRETFGIGTLEAMAAGVPVVGWNYGGQAEIIRNGETGLLVPYGDYEALAAATRQALAKREVLGQAARADVLARWTWPDKVEQYARLFRRTLAAWRAPRPAVSVIVTCHNLARYLPDCLRSVQAQTLQDWECLIVDDASLDETPAIAREFAAADSRFRYLPTPHNLKLSGARNYGFKQATGRYILHLDADDMLTPQALAALAAALDHDPGVHIAYGSLETVGDEATFENTEYGRKQAWPGHFDWLSQAAHLNQLPYCAMMRRAVLERSGGYRERDWRAEDASFWLRVTTLGFRAAKVTGENMLLYRIRPDSKSATERGKYGDADGDWTAWYAWRLAPTAAAGAVVRSRKEVPAPELIPFGAQQVPSQHKNVRHYAEPLVSIIIPVGPGHGRYVTDALDSLLAQTVTDWEAIVVNDTGKPLDLSAWPWARQIDTAGGAGAGAARNRGLEAARGALCLFLDADDWLLGNALATLLEAWLEHPDRYIYSDYYCWKAGGKLELERLRPYTQQDWRGQHAVTVLMTTEAARAVGGFDEGLPGWEDWDFAIKCAIAGFCGQHTNTPTMVYRQFSGQRRDYAAGNMDTLLPVLRERYGDYYDGRKTMACGKCPGSGATPIMQAKQAAAHLHARAAAAEAVQRRNGTMSEAVRMEYIGANTGAISFQRVGGKALTRTYRGGRANTARFADVHPDDVQLLEATGKWKVVPRPGVVATNVPDPGAPVLPPALEVEPAGEIDATDAARELAEEHGLDLSTVTGTGAGHRITVTDVKKVLSEREPA